jgi:hypothetical protein
MVGGFLFSYSAPGAAVFCGYFCFARLIHPLCIGGLQIKSGAGETQWDCKLRGEKTGQSDQNGGTEISLSMAKDTS